MTKNTIKIAGAMLSLLTAFSFQEAQAQTCVQPPSCESLGYTMTEADCSGATLILKCPTDLSKVTCQINPVFCSIGAILYGDGYCYEKGKTPANISPIAVVFDTTNRLAVALTDVKQNGSAGSEEMYWSSDYCDSPNLENCTNESTVKTTCGTDGRANTSAILATNGGCIDYPTNTNNAVNAVNNYQISGCSKTFCQKGKWFLPSVKELYTIYKHKSAINDTLSSLSSIGASQLKEGVYYWSSTVYDAYWSWYLGIMYGNSSRADKNERLYVRPVLAF